MTNSYCISDSVVYGVKPKEIDVYNSASGGVFKILADYFLSHNGIVCGVILDDNKRTIHIMTDEKIVLDEMQNSKYVQSDMCSVYTDIKKILNDDPQKHILFSGTPCQCAGLKKFLGKDFVNLYCLDFICHGVPSQLVFKKYLDWLAAKSGTAINDYQFRTKIKGWNYRGKMCSYVKVNDNYIPTVRDPYMCTFLNKMNYRECCYKCKFNHRKYSDLTVGDFGGVRIEYPDFYSSKGCSIVFINSNKGKLLMQINKDSFLFQKTEYSIVEKYNKNLSTPSKRPIERDTIYSKISYFRGSDYVNKVLKKNVSLHSVVGFYLPYSLVKCIKKIKDKSR